VPYFQLDDELLPPIVNDDVHADVRMIADEHSGDVIGVKRIIFLLCYRPA
jgi:hypothetical protein